MLKFIVVLSLLAVVGCDVTVENFAPSDGYASAKRHIEYGNCSSWRMMDDELSDLKKLGYSAGYIAKFAKSRKRTCDEHLEKALRRTEACAAGTALVPCE